MTVDRGCVLSVYVNLDPREFATAPTRTSALTSAADEASRAVDNDGRELSHEARLQLREDVERIRAYAGSADFAGTQGLAIFSAGGDLFEVLHLPRPVNNAVVVDGSPHIAPLVGEPNGVWCVALVNRRNARILGGGPVELIEEERISDDVPGRHDQGGLSQARYQRHIDEEARRHLERVAEAVAERCRRGAFDHMLVGGPEEGYSEFVELLDGECRERVCGRVAVDVENTTAAQVTEAARPRMREHREAERQRLLERLQQGVGAGGHGAAGLGDVLHCLNEQRVETLVLDAGFTASGAQCPSCGWLTADGDGDCPADGAELEPCTDLVEPAIHRALAQDADVVRLHDRPQMEAHGGIAALLRF